VYSFPANERITAVKRRLFAPAVATLLLVGLPREAPAQIFTAFLDGAQEVPPVDTQATSYSVFLFLFDSVLFGYRFNFNHDQAVQMVHIHEGPVGQDGPIVLALKPDAVCVDILPFFTIYFATAEHLRGRLAGMTLSSLRELMLTGNTYLNLHTELHPDGWIRGQFPKQGSP
jgi:hypothetical protein